MESSVLAGMTWTQFRDLLPVLTFLIGVLASPITDGFKEKRSRRNMAADRAEEFTRSTLLELQTAVFEHSGALQDIINEQQWGRKGDTELYSTAWRSAVHADRLRVLLQDDSLRAEIKKLDALSEKITGLASGEDWQDHRDAVLGLRQPVLDLENSLNEMIGSQLRPLLKA